MSLHDSLEPHAMLLSFLYKLCIPLPSSAGIICKLSAPVGFAEFRVEACLFLFLPPSSKSKKEKASDNSGRASPGPEPSPRPHKQIQTQMEEEEKEGEGVCCYGKRHGRIPITFQCPRAMIILNNTLFPVPFALRPLMDGYIFPII